MKNFTYSLLTTTLALTSERLWIVNCAEDGKWRETFARPTETEARSIGDIWVAEQQEMETFAEPIFATQDTVLVEKMETTFGWLNNPRYIQGEAFNDDREFDFKEAYAQGLMEEEFPRLD